MLFSAFEKRNAELRNRRVKLMTNKERAMNILHYKKADRMPAVHFGYWNELLPEWAEQGHISMDLAEAWGDGNEADRDLDKLLGWDFNWYHTTSGHNSLNPGFEYKVLEKMPDGSALVQNGMGLIEQIKDGLDSIPAQVDYLLKDREAFEELYLPKMKFTPDRINLEAIRKKAEEQPDIPIGLHLGSVLGDIRNIMSVVGMSYMLCDDFELMDEIITAYADLQYECAKTVLESGIHFDFAHYWEDICFKNGPLIGPGMFEELCAGHYKKRNDLVKSYGIDIISLDCDGVTDRLQPIWFANGVNTMFPIEIGTWGDQFEKARQTFGKEMRGVGAMDKTALRKDKAAVDEELKRIERIVQMGGFIPCPDHRIMPGSKWELVQYYAEKVKEMKLAEE